MNDGELDLAARLENAEIVSPLGYGAGFPVLMPWGHQTVERLIGLFRSCLIDVVSAKWHDWDPDLLMDEDAYNAQVGGVGGFDNVYRLELGGRRWVLRPDAAVDGVRRALAFAGPAHAGAAFCAYPAHRDLRGSCTPLWRDRAIWPVMQLDIVAPGAETTAMTAAIATGLKRFFAALGLPTLGVDMGPWKGYARRRHDQVLATELAAPTVLAMAYTVGDHYRSIAEVPQDYEIFDVGLTAKPLATLVSIVAKGERLVLPRAIAPVEVVVAGPDPDALPSPDGIRVARVDIRTRNWASRWACRGVPVLIRVDRTGRAEHLVGNGSWELWDRDNSLDMLVNEACSNAQFATPSVRKGANNDARFAALCDLCALTHVLHAPVVPRIDSPCERCAAAGRLRLMADVDQIY